MQREKDIIFKVPKVEEEGQMPILRKGTENFIIFFNGILFARLMSPNNKRFSIN